MVDSSDDVCHTPNDAEPFQDRNCAPCGSRSGLRWYCVRTGFNSEIIADIEIRLAGFAVFNPSVFRAATRPRRDHNGVVRPGLPDRIVPMFPRYLFVEFDRSLPGWRRIRSLRGVNHIFGSGSETPTPVEAGAIARIRATLAANDCWYPPAHRTSGTPLAKGSKARITVGALYDRAGLVDMSDGQRVRLLMQLMGQSVAVLVNQSDVEPL